MWFSVINIIIDCRYYRNLLIYYTLIVVSIWDSKYRDTIEYNKKTFPPFVSAFNFSFFSLNFHNEMFPELEVGADLHRHVFTINQKIYQKNFDSSKYRYINAQYIHKEQFSVKRLVFNVQTLALRLLKFLIEKQTFML